MMPWHALWPDFLKKRLCRYLLQHYLGHFFKEKISLEQLSIDIYNGTGCVKNLNLDCEALNEQLNDASNTATPSGFMKNDKTSTVPVQIVSGFVGYISVYIPWHDLFNDFCKLTIKNIQITIRVKQDKPSEADSARSKMFDSDNQFFDEDDIESGLDMDGSGNNAMFSSMFVESMMNQSMHIAQECLNEQTTDPILKKKTRFKSGDAFSDSAKEFEDSEGDESKLRGANDKKDGLLGLEAFASTIDSILSRIKINLENIQIRIENLDTGLVSKMTEENIMSSSTMFSARPSNGIALELRIKSIKYFDLDSTTGQPQNKASIPPSSSEEPGHSLPTQTNATGSSNPPGANRSNTTKSFNIEGLTVYFDEFIIKDEVDSENLTAAYNEHTIETNNTGTDAEDQTSLLDSTHSLSSLNNIDSSFNKPQDESPPFNYELNPDYYLYTNPIIFITFSGIQTIKLTINNMKPSDIIEAAVSAEAMTKSMTQSQRPLMELSAQFGSIKCLLCPKQVHLMTDMVTKVTDYVNDANAVRKAKHLRRLSYLKSSKKSQRGGPIGSTSGGSGFAKPVRGCDKRKYEALIQNNLGNQETNLDVLLNEEDEEDEELQFGKSSLTGQSENEQSVMFYSMMSESTAFNNSCLNTVNNINMSNLSNSSDSTNIDDGAGYLNSQGDTNKPLNTDEEEDRKQQRFVRDLKETIEQLQTDIIVANKSTNQTSQHNLFQTFKVTFRMFSLTVLHHDPPVNPKENESTENSSTRRLLVDRMKGLSDNYFDWVSTIDASNLTSANNGSIDKQTLLKYHQALAYNDHFLILMKPINCSLNQKINQRYLVGSKRQSQTIQYSLNELTLSIGYIQLNEYLVPVKPAVVQPSLNRQTSRESFGSTRRARNAKIIEASQAATITELLYFTDTNQSQQMTLEQPCFKLQVIVYEPLELINTLSRSKQSLFKSGKFNAGSHGNNSQNQLLNRHFEHIMINLNQSLSCELDVSIIDRLYYLINDISKYSGSGSFAGTGSSTKKTHFGHDEPTAKKFQNFEIKCSQVVKVALRFPIADLRRAQSQGVSEPLRRSSKPPASSKEPTSSNLNTSSAMPGQQQYHQDQPKNFTFLAQPATMCAFRQLREQILTLHIFDFSFQTLLNQINSDPSTSSFVDPHQLNLIITCSQINAYYQYTKKERPIHFCLIQQRTDEPRSLIVSIRLPVDPSENHTAPDLNEYYSYKSNVHGHDLDSLKVNYNIDVGKANRFNNTTIQEVSETERSDSDESKVKSGDGAEKAKKWRQNQDESESEDDDEDTCGPFSRIHSLISSEKNRRIVNAGNKQEMQAFIQQSKKNSQTVIQLSLPSLKLLVADQKFLNDIYNCFLNDLIMWLPSPVPPIESALNLFYDAQNNPTIFASSGLGGSTVTSPIQVTPNLNYLIDYNFDMDFIATRMNLANNNFISSDEELLGERDDKQFHMCRSAIMPNKSDQSNSNSSDSDGESENKNRRSWQRRYKPSHNRFSQKMDQLKSKINEFKNTLSVVVDVEKAHLKAFVLNRTEFPLAAPLDSAESKDNGLKYGEFDIKADNFHMCIAISETIKNDKSVGSYNSGKRVTEGLDKNQYKIEKQHISIYTDEINICHSTKRCEANVQQLKYPTNFASFETLFNMSKTKELITLNDKSIEQSLFNQNSNSESSTGKGNAPGNPHLNTTMTGSKSDASMVVPMVSIGIKSKFNTKKNTKQLLVALNFKNLSLHHIFTPQPEHWIFQLIELFNLIDIDIVGYEVPIVLTELHLNVENSCVLYKPLYLPSRALIAFKSLHWSSNVTAESTLTLLVFNIEDIYLFISKIAETKEADLAQVPETINLKQQYICVANSDLFELRLLINDEDGKLSEKKADDPTLKSSLKREKKEPAPKLKLPLLDIKIRSNLIQVRTCVDSAFALIELINYIVSDGDLHQPNIIMSEFMSSNQQQQPAFSIPRATSNKNFLERKSSQILAEEMTSAINHEPIQTLTHSEAINIINQSIPVEQQQVSCSIPIQKSNSQPQKISTTFTVGTPPTASFSFKSSSSSFNQQVFYSPQKSSQASVSPASQAMSTASSLQDRRILMAPLPQPSLSFNPKNATNLSNMSLGSGLGLAGTSSSAESLISDMVKEAMTSNPMVQSVYGSLSTEPLKPEPKPIVRKRYTSLTLPPKTDYAETTSMLKTVKEQTPVPIQKILPETDSDNEIYKSNTDGDSESADTESCRINIKNTNSMRKSADRRSRSLSSSRSRSSRSRSNSSSASNGILGINKEAEYKTSHSDADEDLIASIHLHHSERSKQKGSNMLDDESTDGSEEMKEKSYLDDNEDFQFDLPFSDMSPLNKKAMASHHQTDSDKVGKSKVNSTRQLLYEKNKSRLQFRPQRTESDEDEEGDEMGLGYEYNRRGFNDLDEDDDDEGDKSSENEEDLLRDFDVIEVIPGFGEAPKNNKEFDIKMLSKREDRKEILIKEDHFKKPLSKVDVLKAPEAYPVPLNVYCIQEVSVNWCMYGGSDFALNSSNETKNSPGNQHHHNQQTTVSNQHIVNKINRAVSSPIIVAQHQQDARSRHNSTSSNATSISPSQYSSMIQSPDSKTTSGSSPSAQSHMAIKFSNKNTNVSFSKQPTDQASKYIQQRKAGGRIKSKYDHQNLNWVARGGKSRNLDVCMEIALYKVKTKIDLYADLNALDSEEEKQNESPLLYRVALAIGDVEVRDKLASSPFNMFLFRYESDHCPKHTNANMIFLKFLCSKSMDAQRLLECDIKVSIQPLRFNIDQDALIFLAEFFTKLSSKDLNEFSKTLVPPPPPPQAPTNVLTETLESTLSMSPGTGNNPLANTTMGAHTTTTVQTPQQVFIRNFIFSPDLLVRFDFSGKYDGRSETKMDTMTKLLMFAIQLSNTEIKLKRVCYRRGFLGAEKLLQALLKEWLTDIQRNQMKNLIKGWGVFNSVIQFFEGFTYLIWYPIEQYRKDGRVLCGIQKGSAAFSTCTVLATIELTNRMFLCTKNIAEFFYDMVTPHRANSSRGHYIIGSNASNHALVETILTGVGHNRNIRLRRHPNDIREGLTNAYYVMYEGINDTASNLMQEMYEGADAKGIPGAIGGAMRSLPSAALAPIVLTTEATCNILSGIRNQLKPDEKRDDDQKWKTIAE